MNPYNFETHAKNTVSNLCKIIRKSIFEWSRRPRYTLLTNNPQISANSWCLYPPSSRPLPSPIRGLTPAERPRRASVSVPPRRRRPSEPTNRRRRRRRRSMPPPLCCRASEPIGGEIKGAARRRDAAGGAGSRGEVTGAGVTTGATTRRQTRRVNTGVRRRGLDDQVRCLH